MQTSRGFSPLVTVKKRLLFPFRRDDRERETKGGSNIMQRFWLTIGFCCLSASAAYAAPPDQMKEQIMRLLSEVKLKISGAVNEQFCRQFLRAFETQDKIAHIKPLHEVNTYSDPALASYKSKCPKLKAYKRDGEELAEQEFELNETAGDQFGNLWQGTAHFRIYKININNDTKDGDEYVFYNDRFAPKPVGDLHSKVPGFAQDGTYGLYRVVDFEHCETLEAVPVDMQRQFEKGTKRPGYNGILQYRGNVYIFDLYPVKGYEMTLWKYTNRKRKFEAICAYKQSEG